MKRALIAAVISLFAVWLASLAVLLLFLADLTTVPFLVGAIVAQIGVAAVSAGILIETNTRRPWSTTADPFGQTTDELRPGILLPDARPYGRRAHDDRNVVTRLSEVLEDEASRRKPGETPAWVVSMNQRHQDASAPFSVAPEESRE